MGARPALGASGDAQEMNRDVPVYALQLGLDGNIPVRYTQLGRKPLLSWGAPKNVALQRSASTSS